MFADDDDKVRDAVGIAEPDDHRVAAQQIPVDEKMRGVVLVDMPGHDRRVFGGFFPVKPSSVGVAGVGLEKGVEPARVEVGAVGRENHGGRGHGASLGAKGILRGAERIVSPAIISLRKMGHVVEDGERKPEPAARFDRRGGGRPAPGPPPRGQPARPEGKEQGQQKDQADRTHGTGKKR